MCDCESTVPVSWQTLLQSQDKFLAYMKKEFQFDHVKNPAVTGDLLHLHVYRMTRSDDGGFRLAMVSRLSTDVDGIAICLGLQAEARIELEQIIATLQDRISPATLFRPL